MGHEKSIYIALRRRYQPVPIRLIIIAESPPDSGKYFYNPEGSRGEVLFREMMKLINVTSSATMSSCAITRCSARTCSN
jgi:hypothetical protein